MSIYINNKFIINFFFFYSLLMSIFYFSESFIFKYIIFSFSMLVILFITIIIIKNLHLLPTNFVVIGIFYFIFLILSIIFNYHNTDLTFSIKYYGIISFFFAGYLINLSENINLNKIEKIKLLIILLLPLIIYFIDIYIRGKDESSNVFVNRNNAVLFGIISSYILLLFLHSFKLFILFIAFNVIIFKTLGAFLATLISLVIIYLKNISIKKLFKLLLYAIIFFSALFFILSNTQLGIVERIKDLEKGFQALYAFLQHGVSITKISYGDVAQQAGTSDLSFLFRIKHWYHIMNVFLDNNIAHILFGNGNDSIPQLTTVHLRAHNDYLRLLYECGLFFVLIFFIFNLLILRSIGINLYSLPLMIVLMYYFTENLVDNFFAMSLLYYFLGLILAQKNKGVLKI